MREAVQTLPGFRAPASAGLKGNSSIRWAVPRVVLAADAELGFNLLNPLMETVLDLRDGFTLAQMAGLIKMLQISAQLQKELVGKTVAHRRSIFALKPVRGKMARIACAASLQNSSGFFAAHGICRVRGQKMADADLRRDG
jgi:hypothetical protein